MNLIKRLNPDFCFKDYRGSLVQLVKNGYKQVNVIESVKGVVRGGHYHVKNSEAFYIIYGEVRLRAWNLGNEEDNEEYIFSDGDMFEIDALTVHDFFFIKKTLLVSMYSDGVELENGEKDIIAI